MPKIPIIRANAIKAKFKYWYFTPIALNFLNGTNNANISCSGLLHNRLKLGDTHGCSEKNVRKKTTIPAIPYIPNNNTSNGL